VRKADLEQNHDPFDEAIVRYRGFMERIVAAQRVVRTLTEKQDVAESVLLRLCAHWERFVDEHLVDCVNCDHSKLNDYLGVTIPRHPSRSLCQAVLFGGGYKDFKNFGDLKGFTKKVLPDESNPFLVISVAHGTKIDEVFKIRNYLAHYSAAARRALDRMYEQSYGIQRFQEPGRFLLANGGRRLWAYFDAFTSVSTDMRAWCTTP
jgi:hypothetical protein